MKKLLISFSLMFVLLVSTGSVFATYVNLQDSYRWLYSAGNEGTAWLKGRRDNSTDRLSNVSTDKEEVGKVYVEFLSVTRPSQYTATAKVLYSYKGITQKNKTLSI